MDHIDSELIVYYSNFGLEQSNLIQIVGARSHSSRIRAMILLSDTVKIPLSHLLRMSQRQYSSFLETNGELLAQRLLRIDMTSEYSEPETYAYDFQRRIYGGRKDAMKRIESFLDHGFQVSTALATGTGQSAVYRSLMSNALERGLLGSHYETRRLRPLISVVNAASSKEEFDYLLGKTARDYGLKKRAIELSNIAYYMTGAITDQNIITTNSFITSDKAMAMQELAEEVIIGPLSVLNVNKTAKTHNLLTSILFNPDTFLLFLKTIGAIKHINDLSYLSDTDLLSIRRDSGFRVFLNHYKRLATNSANLADLLIQYDSEARRKYRGMTLAAGVLLAAFVNAANNDLCIPDGSLHDFLETVKSTVELIGYIEAALKVGHALQLGEAIEESTMIADSIIRMAEASIYPLSYAASLVQKTVKRNT